MNRQLFGLNAKMGKQMGLGKLERVELRTVWNNEATDFTPWLAKPENLEALSETLGMDLESSGTEQSVGPYRADMLCKDAFSGSPLLCRQSE